MAPKKPWHTNDYLQCGRVCWNSIPESNDTREYYSWKLIFFQAQQPEVSLPNADADRFEILEEPEVTLPNSVAHRSDIVKDPGVSIPNTITDRLEVLQEPKESSPGAVANRLEVLRDSSP